MALEALRIPMLLSYPRLVGDVPLSNPQPALLATKIADKGTVPEYHSPSGETTTSFLAMCAFPPYLL